MRKHDFYYNSQTQSCTKYISLLILALFCLTISTFALFEVSNFYADEPTVARILMNSLKSYEGKEPSNAANNKVVLVNLEEQEQQQDKEELLRHIVKQQEMYGERQARAATDNSTNSSAQKSSSYYEEQSPVVVYSKTDVDSSIAQRQLAEVPPKQDADEEDGYYSKTLAEDYEGSEDNDYFGQQEKSKIQDQPLPYYRQQQQQLPQPYYREQPSPSYYRQPQPYYRQSPPSPQYYDDSREAFPGPDDEQTSSEEARSSQYHIYRKNNRQYPYATESPILATESGNNKILSAANSDMPFATRKAQPQYREPYPTYMDDYDYLSSHSSPEPRQPPPYANRKVPPHIPQYRTPSPTLPAKENPESGQQMDLLTMLKSVKTMWDLYQSFTSSWNTLAERHNREEEITKQKYKQVQQIRINSKKPPKFKTRNNTTTTNKNLRKQTTTTSSTEVPTAAGPLKFTSNEEEVKEEREVKKQPVSKVEPRKNTKRIKANSNNEMAFRDKRQAGKGMKASTDVGEARYIKGDPLKGYYDFVITEGSYKFWAAFQVGTAILIIYSTFAAIYYSKVNPLVSDYDYTDYLGGARSLSGGDLDFVDDDESAGQKPQTKNWLEWLPRTGHSLKFILDAIDKLPIDHAAKEVDEETFKEDGSKVSADKNENTNEMEPAEKAENSEEFAYTSETENLNESANINEATGYNNNKAM